MIGGDTYVLTREGIVKVREVSNHVVYLSCGHRWIPATFEPAGYLDCIYRSIQSLGFYCDLTLDEAVLDCNARAVPLSYFDMASTHRSTVRNYRFIHRQFVPSPDYGDAYPPDYLQLSQFDDQTPLIPNPLSVHPSELEASIIEASKQSFARRYWECSYILNHYAKLALSNRSSALFMLWVPNITAARLLQLFFASCNLVTKIRPAASTLSMELRKSCYLSGDFSRYRFPAITLRITEGRFFHITNPFIKDFFDRNLHKSYTATETRHYREFFSQPIGKRLRLKLKASEGYRNYSYFYLINPPSREAMPTVVYQERLEYNCDVYHLRHAENQRIIAALVGGYFITQGDPRFW